MYWVIGAEELIHFDVGRRFLLMVSVAQGVHQMLFIRESSLILYIVWKWNRTISYTKFCLCAQLWLLKGKICMVFDICCWYLLPWIWCYHSQWSTELVDFSCNWLVTLSFTELVVYAGCSSIFIIFFSHLQIWNMLLW